MIHYIIINYFLDWNWKSLPYSFIQPIFNIYLFFINILIKLLSFLNSFPPPNHSFLSLILQYSWIRYLYIRLKIYLLMSLFYLFNQNFFLQTNLINFIKINFFELYYHFDSPCYLLPYLPIKNQVIIYFFPSLLRNLKNFTYFIHLNRIFLIISKNYHLVQPLYLHLFINRNPQFMNCPLIFYYFLILFHYYLNNFFFCQITNNHLQKIFFPSYYLFSID